MTFVRILLALLLAAPAFAADVKVSAMTAASALSGAELFYCSQSSADRKCTATQIKAFTSSSPTLVTPILGVATATSVNKVTITAPATSATLTIPDGLTLNAGAGGTIGALGYLTPGTGVATAAAINVGSAGAFVTFNGAGGTPSSMTGTNITGIPPAGVTGTAAILGANTFTAAQTAPGYIMSSGGIITDATTTRTLSAGDNGKIIYFTSGSAITLSMASGLGAGFSCQVLQGGAGQITFAANSQTMTVAGGATKTAYVAAMALILAPAANTFFISGTLQ